MEQVVCLRCGTVDDYYTIPAGPHTKAICNNCDRYIKFIKKTKHMSTLITGSLCFTDLMNQAKVPHSAFTRGKNGKAYVNIAVWVNDEPDQFGNDVSFQLNSTKEKRDSEGKVYVGNGKKVQSAQATPAPAQQANEVPDDLPF